MWADTLLALERGHLVRLALWGGGSVLLGTLLYAVLSLRRVEGAAACATSPSRPRPGGRSTSACALWAWRGLALRNFAGAQQLVNFLWLNTGSTSAT